MAEQATKVREKTYDDLQAEIGKLRDDISSLTNTVKGVASSEARAASDKVRDTADRLRTRGHETVDHLRERAQETVDTQVRPKIQENPFSSVLIAFGVGFVVGNLLRRG
jgi:ElaB/YqjD/DUF883 family membrane-anchored ribosome-binding protein